MGAANTGAIAGQEIVQLYIWDEQAKLVRLIRELKAFAKVALEPGQTKTVNFQLNIKHWPFMIRPVTIG